MLADKDERIAELEGFLDALADMMPVEYDGDEDQTALIEQFVIDSVAKYNRYRRENLELIIGEVLFNASNFPEAVQSRLLGQDMLPLRDKLVEAVLHTKPTESLPGKPAAGIAESNARIRRLFGV